MPNCKELSIKQNMIWNMAGSAIGLACQWAISILVVRLAPDLTTAGLYSLAMSVYGIFSPIAHFGMYTYLITDVEDRNSIGEYITLASVTSFLAFSITMGYSIITCRSNSWPIIACYSVYKGLAVMIDILHAADQKAHRMDYVGISLGLQGVLCLLAFSAILSFTSNLSLAIMGMAVCTLLIGLLYDLPKTKSLFHVKVGISKKKALCILSACSLIVISSIASGAFASVPRQMLSQELGDAALGIYASAATPVAIIQVGSTYIYNPLIGYFAESYHSKNKSSFIRLSLMTVFGIIAIGLISLVCAHLFAEPVLFLLYGKEVASHSELMTPLILSSILLGTSGFANSLLVAVRSMRVMLLANIASLGAVVLLSKPMIMAFGMNGATVSLIIGCLLSVAISIFGVIMQAGLQFNES